MNKLLSIACGFLGALIMMSCMDATIVEADMSQMEDMGISHFDGTIYEYLEQGDSKLKVTFDSLLYLLNYDDPDAHEPLKFKELKACLQDEQGEYTLFAVPDSCFRLALQRLNRYRRLNRLDEIEKDLCLEKLLDYHKEIEREPESVHTPAVIDVYEYKQALDSLSCRYVARGDYSTEALASASVSESGQIVRTIFYEYRMYVQYERKPASGLVGAGVKNLTFYDMQNTLQRDVWIPTNALWTDVLTKNGIIHVLTPEHEFGYGMFIHSFKNLGNEE